MFKKILIIIELFHVTSLSGGERQWFTVKKKASCGGRVWTSSIRCFYIASDVINWRFWPNMNQFYRIRTKKTHNLIGNRKISDITHWFFLNRKDYQFNGIYLLQTGVAFESFAFNLSLTFTWHIRVCLIRDCLRGVKQSKLYMALVLWRWVTIA